MLLPILFSDVYALSGKDGVVVEGWPVHVGKRIPANILATKLSSSHSALDLVSVIGQLTLIDRNSNCKLIDVIFLFHKEC